MKILVLDNYDSFTYNLVQYLERIQGVQVDVFRNDKIGLEEIEGYDKILLSPGPGIPKESGIMMEVIKAFYKEKSMLGICLGLQAIGEVFGGQLRNLESVYHGVATEIEIIQEDVLFKGVPKKFIGGRYHSWVVDEEEFPKELDIICKDVNGYVMGLRHKSYDVSGLQFHPESILTEHGFQIMQNWVSS